MPIDSAGIFLLHGEDFTLALADFQSAGTHARLQIGVVRVEELHFLEFLEGFVVIALLFEDGGAGEKFADAGGLIDLLGRLVVNLLGGFGIGAHIEGSFGVCERLLPVAVLESVLRLLDAACILLGAHLVFGDVAVGGFEFRFGLLVFGAKLECILGPVAHAVPLLFPFALFNFGHGREELFLVLACGGFCHRLFVGKAGGFAFALGLGLCIALGDEFLLAEFAVLLGFGAELVEVNLAIDGDNFGKVAAAEINEVFFLKTVAGRDGFAELFVHKSIAEEEDTAEKIVGF